MKNVIISTLIAGFMCTTYVNANAQQVVAATLGPDIKTILLSTATAKDLPEGVAFINNKVVAKPGYKFEQLPNGGIRVVDTQNAKSVNDSYYVCKCDGGSCRITTTPNSLECGGDGCCQLYLTINIPPIPPKKAIKKSNTIKKSVTVETKQ
jgi:hypothetical protein